MHRREFVQQMRQLLIRRRAALQQALSGELSRFNISEDREVGDEVDAALDTDYGLINANLAQVESTELARIDAALDRIRNNEYGVCAECGKRIPVARLRAIPYAEYCVKCQSAMDRESRSAHSNATGWEP